MPKEVIVTLLSEHLVNVPLVEVKEAAAAGSAA
jgi:hypothetical protein